MSPVGGDAAARSPMPADDRGHPPFLAGDRESLESWLDLYRATLLLKVGGLTADQLCARPTPPSTMSLGGLVRHLTYVERTWFANVVAGEDLPPLYCQDDPDGDFNDVDPATVMADLVAHQGELVASRRRAARVTDLDAPLPGKRHGRRLNLRWVLTHLIEEYARHLGHADLMREALDGTTGY
ncbi:DinB family protein [Propionibacteriaceae bacterium Y2011]